MATKSFLKNVSLRSPAQCKAFIKALERSEMQVKTKSSSQAKPTRDMDKETIRKVFASE